MVEPSTLALEIEPHSPAVLGALRPAVQALRVDVLSPSLLVDGRAPSARTLLPLSATKQERDIELSIARAGRVSTKEMRATWDADTCPASLLPWLAWAMSVDTWDSSWTEEQKRGAIRNSFLIHKVKGTLAAVKRALAAVSFSSELIEWFNDAEPDADPYTFRIEVYADDVSISDAIYNQIISLINQSKNVRSHMRRISAVTRIRGSLIAASVMLSGVLTTVYPYAGGTEEVSGLLSTAGACIMGDVVIVYPDGHTFEGSGLYDGDMLYDGSDTLNGP